MIAASANPSGTAKKKAPPEASNLVESHGGLDNATLGPSLVVLTSPVAHAATACVDSIESIDEEIGIDALLSQGGNADSPSVNFNLIMFDFQNDTLGSSQESTLRASEAVTERIDSIEQDPISFNNQPIDFDKVVAFEVDQVREGFDGSWKSKEASVSSTEACYQT